MGILKAISSGKVTSNEITSKLFSFGLIKKEDPSLIQPYLKILENLGLIKKIKNYHKNRYFYYVESPLLDLYFYLDSKYGYVEEDIPVKYIQKVIEEKLPLHVEMFLTNLLSKVYGLKPVKINEPEIDIALVKFNKLRLVCEVKWKNKIKNSDIDKSVEKLKNFDCEKVFICKKIDEYHKKKLLDHGIKTLTQEDLLKMSYLLR